ncbi:ACT domain-containing protein [Zongyangia hominis]|uniref:UPF0735 ACT domain-containing protein H8709_01240 n=1 Tax=Zongyangia hominis TaxID=2763677 RepID=A0A926EAJ6_9FIRM|nr:ACT domain-containing protein [Zongyangia hominis]MBC8569455.1 ACT domain-containing protein [Zongyangia hominis]
MDHTTQYLLVDTKVLPEIFSKVVEAKHLLASGKAKNSSEAARMMGISRSAFYKYKDSVYPYTSNVSENIITIYAALLDEPGVLSRFLSELYQVGANVLTINQNIPVDSVAPVSISVSLEGLTISREELFQNLRQVEGVAEVRRVSGQ